MRAARGRRVDVLLLLVVIVGLVGLGGCRRKAAPRAPTDVRLPSVRTGETQTGLASWYGDPFHGRRTASGEIFNKRKFTAAHRTLPFHTWVRVTNLENGQFTTVRINDRGPFIEGRIIDLSQATAQALDMIGAGTALVRLDVIQKPDGEPSPNARFGVQVGAFLVRENAERLQRSLAKEFRDVFIESYDAPDGRYFRVRVGRTSESEALRLAERLRRRAHMSELFVVRLN
ncbi:MAG: septal ring lytic transglycosylase RlpA family protein [Terriglobia bacterium]